MLADFDREAAVRRFAVTRWRHARGSQETDLLVVEEPLEIRVNGQALAVVMRTPGADLELAYGFLLAEGIFADAGGAAMTCTEAHEELGLAIPNVVNCEIPNFSMAEFEKQRRRLTATSSCGICGRASLERVFLHAPAPRGDFEISLPSLLQLPRQLREQQTAFAQTGGLHAAALFNTQGEISAAREDIGRHNAVDKVIGWALQQSGFPLHACGLLVSGRLSFEMAQKALLAGISMVVAISAASALAVELAEESGMTLAGFLREQHAVVYTGAQRIRGMHPDMPVQ